MESRRTKFGKILDGMKILRCVPKQFLNIRTHFEIINNRYAIEFVSVKPP